MFYDPRIGHGLPHNPANALVAPRPIGWVSTLSPDGTANLAPYSYFNTVSTEPFIVMVSASGSSPHTLANMRATGEFVVNIVGSAFLHQMVETSIDAPAATSEFDVAGLGREPSTAVAPPRVRGIPAALECKVSDFIRPRGADGTQSRYTVAFGEVVGVHIDDAMLTDGRFDAVRAGLVARLGYLDYSRITDIFERRRPRWQA